MSVYNSDSGEDSAEDYFDDTSSQSSGIIPGYVHRRHRTPEPRKYAVGSRSLTLPRNLAPEANRRSSLSANADRPPPPGNHRSRRTRSEAHQRSVALPLQTERVALRSPSQPPPVSPRSTHSISRSVSLDSVNSGEHHAHTTTSYHIRGSPARRAQPRLAVTRTGPSTPPRQAPKRPQPPQMIGTDPRRAQVTRPFEISYQLTSNAPHRDRSHPGTSPTHASQSQPAFNATGARPLPPKRSSLSQSDGSTLQSRAMADLSPTPKQARPQRAISASRTSPSVPHKTRQSSMSSPKNLPSLRTLPSMSLKPKPVFNLDSLQYASSDSETSSSDDLYESEESYESDGEENEDSLVYSWVDRSKTLELRDHWHHELVELEKQPEFQIARMGNNFQQWLRRNELPPGNHFRTIFEELSEVLSRASDPHHHSSMGQIYQDISTGVKKLKRAILDTLIRVKSLPEKARSRFALPNVDRLDFHLISFKLLSGVSAKYSSDSSRDPQSIISVVRNFTEHVKSLHQWYIGVSAALKS